MATPEGEPTESILLTHVNFITEAGRGTWFVKHYAPWCPHCQALAPFWAQLSVKYKEFQKTHGFHFGEIDCDVEGQLCDDHEVRGYPTIILYHKGEKVGSFEGRTNTDYYLDNYLKNVTTWDWDGTGGKPKFEVNKLSAEEKNELSVPISKYTFDMLDTWNFSLVNFCDFSKDSCSKFATKWLELAHTLKSDAKTKDLTLAQVDCGSEIKFCGEQKVTEFPTIKLFHKKTFVDAFPTSKVEDIESLNKFIIEKIEEQQKTKPQKTPASERPKDKTPQSSTETSNPEVTAVAETETGAKPLDKPVPDESDSSIHDSYVDRSLYLGSKNFTEVAKEGIWFIQFRSPTPGVHNFDLKWAHLSNDFSLFLTRYGVKFGIVDCGSDREFCDKNGAKSFPDVQIYEFGAHVGTYSGTNSYEDLKSYIRENTHQLHSASSLPTYSFPSALTPNIEGKVIYPVGANFDKLTEEGPWFVFFKTTTCQICRTIVPDWEDLAKRFKKQVNFAIVDCQKEALVCSKLSIQTYPSFKFFKGGAVRDYRGPHNLESLDHYAKAASSPHLHILDSESLKKLSQKESSYFIYIYDELHSTDSLASLEPILKGLYLNLDLYIIPSDKATGLKIPEKLPALQVFHDDKFNSQYPGSIDDVNQTREWFSKYQFGPITALNIANFDLFMNYYDSVIVAVVEPLKDSATIEQYRDSANQYKSKSTSKVGFAVLDGIQWKEYIERVYQLSQKDLPFVAVTHPKHNTFETKLPNGQSIPFSGSSLAEHIDGFVSKYDSVKVVHQPSGFSFPTFILILLVFGILFGLYRNHRRSL